MIKPSYQQDSRNDINISHFRIIVIEEDEGLRRLILKKLNREGFIADEAGDAGEAFQKIQGESNEILLLDYNLPDMNGKQLIKKLIKKYNKTPNFITLTGFGDVKLAVEMMKLGSLDYMIKEPDFVDILPQTLKQVIDYIDKEKTNAQLAFELGERLKEMNCLYSITTIIEKPGNTLEKILQESVNTIPSGWQYPEKTCAKIICNNQEFKTDNFQVTKNKISEDLIVEGEKSGTVDVFLFDTPEQHGKLNFLEEEKKLLFLISERLGKVLTRFQINNKLNESRELLKDTGEVARVGGWEIDLNTKHVFWTETTKKIHEVPDDYIPTLAEAIKFFPEEYKIQIEKAIEKAIQEGIDYDLELQFITAKGNKLWVEAIGKPEMMNGKCVRLHGTIQDITRRKEAENKLKINNAILKRTEQIAHLGSWEWDVASDTVTWSDELFNIFKRDFKKGAPSYTEHPKFYTPRSMKKLNEAVQKCLKTGKPYEIDLEILRGDGKTAFCTARGFAKKDDNGKVILLFGSLQDITDRQKAEKKLKTLNEKLIASEQQLIASNQQLIALNQQLVANQQQLRAANQQLAANDQQLRAANQQLVASEAELRKSNETLKKYLDVAAEIIVLLDKTGKITLLNERGHRILGYKPGELIGKNWFETCLPEEKRETVKAYLSTLKKYDGDRFERRENEVITKTGERKTILWHNTVIGDDEGNYAGTLSSGEDITERKIVEQNLIESEERFRKAQKAGNIGSWEFNLQTEEFWGSDEGKRIYNLDLNKKEFAAEEVMNLVEEKDRARVSQAMIDLVAENKPYDIIFEITPKNTSDKKIIHSKAELQKDKNGLPYKVTGVLRDITMQKRMEKQLIDAKEKAEESEAFLKAIFENSLNAIVVSDDEGKYITANESAARLLGYSQEKLLKMKVTDLKTIENKGASKKFNEYLSKGEDSGEFEFITPDGIKKTALYTAVRVKKDFNLSVLLDITKRKQVEMELIKAKEKAEEADHLKSAFLANMSHEIRTPMNGIIGFTNLLKEADTTGEEQQRFVEIIQRSGYRMLETVNALIDISKIETGQVVVSIENVDIQQEVQSLFDFFSAEAKQKRLAFNLDNRLPKKVTTIQSDKQKLISIMSNLIKNAIKYTDEGFIKVGLELKENDLHFYVKDSGIGVPKNRQQAIFNRFEQADIKDTRAFQGSGLGLAITKAYVEMLGGKIGVESEEGKGSTFRVQLPL